MATGHFDQPVRGQPVKGISFKGMVFFPSVAFQRLEKQMPNCIDAVVLCLRCLLLL